jgi:hypothetical protein
MNLHFIRTLSRSLSLVALSLSASALADDQTVTGNLSVTGDADIRGNTLSVGTRTDSITTPGVNLLYSDGTAPSIYFTATRSGANWLWQSNTSAPQLRLSGSNKLLLYDQATTPTAKITLDPIGTSTFAQSVTLNGTDNRMPNQTITGPGSILTQATGLTQTAADGIYLRQDLTSLSIAGGSVSGYNSTGMSAGDASADYSTAMSSGYASGNYATAMSYATANGQYSTAMSNGYASGDCSTAMSSGNASGFVSTAMTAGGANGDYSTAMSGGSASGQFSTAMSYGSTYGFCSTAMSNGSAYGFCSTAMSYATSNGDYSTAMGGGTANGAHSTAVGPNTTANGLFQIVVGHGNIPQGDNNNPLPDDDLFIIGNGGPRSVSNMGNFSPSNAFIIKENGNMWVGGDSTLTGKVGIGITTPAEKLEVAGNIKAAGTVTAAKIRVPASGDLSMGDFIAGANPAN